MLAVLTTNDFMKPKQKPLFKTYVNPGMKTGTIVFVAVNNQHLTTQKTLAT